MNKNITLGILAAGTSPEELQEHYGSYASMTEALLRRGGLQAKLRVYNVRDGEFPASVNEASGWIITGSKFSVYDDIPWIKQLIAFAKEAWNADRPLVGICFGHQLLAKALGGDVQRYDGGWGLGCQSYQIIGEMPGIIENPQQADIRLQAFHQDQVTGLPPEARCFVRADYCRYAALVYGDQAISVQAHPEFSHDYEQALLSLRQGESLPVELTGPALQSLVSDDDLDNGRVGRWMVRFLQRALLARASG